ncbi:CoA transferase [Burkholderia sp. LMU1-1-1.1]|uniref:CoA transferase n=1 Tax=Burkholderia sp. LMU1-1-1.1 TaxID=3135266 RepID=UPI0034286272
MSVISRHLLQAAASALALPDDAPDAVRFEGNGALPSYYAVSDLAAASVGAAALALRQLIVAQGGDAAPVHVDRRLASLWFGWSIHPIGWERPPLWDAVAGDYATADGWIRLHTNAIHHRDAALAVLGCEVDRDAVARAVAGWRGGELEAAVVGNGGCAAMMRSAAEWAAHPQGVAVAAEPLVALETRELDGAASAQGWHRAATPGRPLAGLKVLDLTRVLAGPVATRFLAGYGADVLRIDPPDWNEPGVIPEVTPGKRCARLDLRQPADRAIFEDLLARADVLVHGYRPAALERLGYGEQFRRALNPGLIDVSLDAYGWTGPLAGRRGFDSLVQMSSGIADHGMRMQGASKPVPLPVQALDHATGYLMAAAVLRGLVYRLTENRAMGARLSLARTAKLLADSAPDAGAQPLGPAGEADLSPGIEHTEWGAARRLLPPVVVGGAPMVWDGPAASLGSSTPRFLNL